jgi:multiple sugar transport system ATP-binding protein
MAGVRLVGVRKIYEERGHTQVAVHDLDLEVADGEFVVLVGPSGCGKSTTLRMIAGLEPISGGQAFIGERLVNDIPAKDRDIAMVFQNYALYPHMTAYDNLAFALTLKKLAKPEIDRRVREAAGMLGIEGLLSRRPRQMSGGERQRVALGRALVRHPQVFLFDEPLSNLDAKLRVQMRREIARLHRQLGATMIYVTHDQVEAMTLGDRIVVLSRGEVQQVDTPTALYEYPRNTFVASFIGTPPMNLIEGRMVRAGMPRFEAQDGSLSLPLDGPHARKALDRSGSVILGVRPEHLQPAQRTRENGSDLNGKVDLVELLGGEALVHLSVGQVELTGRFATPPVPQVGSELRVSIPADRIHLFDGESGQRLS